MIDVHNLTLRYGIVQGMSQGRALVITQIQ
jgi:hypothetical protein